jgi:hypothetical protein
MALAQPNMISTIFLLLIPFTSLYQAYLSSISLLGSKLGSRRVKLFSQKKSSRNLSNPRMQV